MRPAGRALIGLWASVLAVAGGGAIALEILGPPPAKAVRPAPPRAAPGPGAPRHPAPLNAAPPPPPPPAAAATIPPPDPALLEPAPDFPDRMLPRIAADGRTPAHVYAAHAGLPPHGPLLAILVEGIGLHDTYSRDAIDRLPAAISFGVSPYTASFEHPVSSPLLDAARAAGHELWLSLPMEPAGSPTDDEGPQALSTSIDFAHDRQQLEWALSRFGGYVGATNALSGLRGDRFVASTAFAMVDRELNRRGLLYLDAGTAPHEDNGVVPDDRTRHADLTIDETPDAPDIEARLSRLEQIATTQGSALGIAGPLRPVLIERLHDWSQHLSERGISLVPVSALPLSRPSATPAAAPVPGPAPTDPPAASPP